MELWKIDEAIARLLMLPDGNGVDTETGEVFTPEAIDALNVERNEKIEACLLFAKSQEAEAKMVGEEAKKLLERQKACEKRATRTLEYVKRSLNGEPFKTSKAIVRYNTSYKCEISCDVNNLPDQFKKITTTVTPLKEDLKKYINAGNTVAGVTVVENKTITVK